MVPFDVPWGFAPLLLLQRLVGEEAFHKSVGSS